MAATLILGAVKCIHVRKAVLNERGVVDPAKFKPIGRMGGTTYVRLGDAFDLARGSWSDVATAAL
jgi:flavin reductase (DIM6/NTAB) family NADH-FMN oxidoreductase RutF